MRRKNHTFSHIHFGDDEKCRSSIWNRDVASKRFLTGHGSHSVYEDIETGDGSWISMTISYNWKKYHIFDVEYWFNYSFFADNHMSAW